VPSTKNDSCSNTKRLAAMFDSKKQSDYVEIIPHPASRFGVISPNYHGHGEIPFSDHTVPTEIPDSKSYLNDEMLNINKTNLEFLAD